MAESWEELMRKLMRSNQASAVKNMYPNRSNYQYTPSRRPVQNNGFKPDFSAWWNAQPGRSSTPPPRFNRFDLSMKLNELKNQDDATRIAAARNFAEQQRLAGNPLYDAAGVRAGAYNSPNLPTEPAPVDDAFPDPSAGGGNQPYVDRNLLARIQGLSADTSGLYDAAAEKIKSIYADTSQDLTSPISNTLAQYAQGAENLGMGEAFKNDENVKLYDAAGRQLKETNDLNMATDLATVEKLKGMRSEIFAGLANAVANGWNPYDSGGSGAGGGSSDMETMLKMVQELSSKDTANEEIEASFPEVPGAIANTADDRLRALYEAALLRSKGDVNKLLQTAQADYDSTVGFKPTVNATTRARNFNPFRSGGLTRMSSDIKRAQEEARRQQALNAQRARDSEALINFFRNFSPMFGSAVTNRTVTNTGTSSSKNTYTNKS